MSENAKPVFYRRQFLNTSEHGGHAFLEAHVTPETWHKDNSMNVRADFEIADCSRMITLDFNVYSPEDSANVRQKMIAFRRAVVAFEAALVAQLNEFDKQPPEPNYARYVNQGVNNEGRPWRETGFAFGELKKAARFSSADAALRALQDRSERFNFYPQKFVVVKVEEVTTAARREIVNDGPLSLLNSAVVLYSPVCNEYLTTASWAQELEDATAFKSASDALSTLQDRARRSKVCSRMLIQAVREVRGETSYKETVLQ